MLAENLVDSSPLQHVQELPAIEYKEQTDVNGCEETNNGIKKSLLFSFRLFLFIYSFLLFS